MLLPFLPFFLLSLLPTPSSAQLGTAQSNISSDSTQMTYYGAWRSMTLDGVYEAYSNASNASVVFSFTGVGVSYVAIKKYDRGLCQLIVDGVSAYTVDLYDNSGYTQYQTVLWTSPTLPYGDHNVTLQQIGADARFGYYPYLLSETWIQVRPINVASYTATQILTTATTGANPTSTSHSHPSTSSSTNLAPIVGGCVGGVVALGLVAFLVFLWRKDKRSKERGGGRMIKKVKKAEGKMSIEEDDPDAARVGYMSGAGQGGEMEYGRIDPGGGRGYGHKGGYSMSSSQQHHGGGGGGGGRDMSWGGYGGQVGQSHEYLQQGGYGAGVAAPGSPETRRESSGWGEEVDVGRDNRAYPYHVQGAGDDLRTYPVPEI